MTSEAQKRSVRKYDQENTIQVKLKLNKKTDQDIIRQLERSGNKQGYIKELIKKDMEGNKMKKEFTVNLYTAEITRRKLKELLSGKDITQYEHILTDYAINNDTCPDIIGSYATKEEAEKASCPNGEITLFPAAVSYYRICCNGIIEEYNISEDDTAEFVDMDYSGKMFSQEELKKLREDLF